MNPSIRALAVPALAAGVGIAILVSLGVWQLQRLQWKEALIARVEVGLSAEPVAAPGPGAWADLDLAEREYQRVAATGHFLERGEVYVVYTLTAPKGPVGGVGYLVMTPLVTDDGWTVYVNRGFVPRDKRDPDQRAGSMIEGETTVTGLLRAPRRRAWFMPADDIAGNAWFSRDPRLYAEANGTAPGDTAPYIIDVDFDPSLPGGLPQGGETIVTFPNNHLQYALTWFGLAIVLAAVFTGFVWSRLRDAGSGA